MAITPLNDGLIEGLLEHCREHLNTQAISWAAAAGQPQKVAITDIKPIECTIEAVQKLPLLAGYRVKFSSRNGSAPNTYVTARLDYWVFKNMQNRQGQDALFTWVARQLPNCLEAYNASQDCMRIEIESIQSQTRYIMSGSQGGVISIPFLRTEFRFDDFEKPAP